MSDLSKQECNEVQAAVLNKSECNLYLPQLNPPWEINENNNMIARRFQFKNYYQTMAFVNVIAQIAHQQNHHPDLLVQYNQCTVTYSTHSVNGLSIKDFICAAKVNAAQQL